MGKNILTLRRAAKWLQRQKEKRKLAAKASVQWCGEKPNEVAGA
tara:strand:+ start:973 stop:1104 length:132 start_codon:yes stop_codon:yes gene_type:complete